ncbi:MAG TPA: mechanosensitive ion channel family protein, partial [Salinimicrobium sp.]|nr:mechanosensitive ion channel family protein [Salinimicrobium sp.]
RNQTNLGIFRKYANTYLEKHPLISKELFIMARLLAPTTQGIPLEIYCFSSEKRWAYFEEVNADIFEHLIAAIPYFDLQLFEEPSGDDIIKISKILNPNNS